MAFNLALAHLEVWLPAHGLTSELATFEVKLCLGVKKVGESAMVLYDWLLAGIEPNNVREGPFSTTTQPD